MEKASDAIQKSLVRRYNKFMAILNLEVIDLDKLRNLSWGGVPQSKSAAHA